MPNHIPIITGAIFGLGVRFWRYRPKTMMIARDILVGSLSTLTLLHLMPSDVNNMWSFITAYFTAQSASHGLTRIQKMIKK